MTTRSLGRESARAAERRQREADREQARMLAGLALLNKAEAARALHVPQSALKALWDEIPQSYRTPGGRYRVTVIGLNQWVTSGAFSAAMAATSANAAGVIRGVAMKG